jgi:hypothetical protein
MAIVLDGSNRTTSGVINRGTAVASTSGTSIDFTGIPIGASRITVMFNAVSTNGTSNVQIQLGGGSVETTGYVCSSTAINGTNTSASSSSTTGLIIMPATAAASVFYGTMVLTLVSSNIWVLNGVITGGTGYNGMNAGSKTTTATLDRVRITTVNGTDAFDAGTINILYE